MYKEDLLGHGLRSLPMPNKNSKSEVGCFEEKLGLYICIGGGTRVGGKKKSLNHENLV